MDLKECLVVASFSVLILAQLSLSEIFELHSPPSVIGHLGQDAILPCQISLGTQPQNMEVQWTKLSEDHYDSIYQFTAVTGQETFEPSYLGRASVATKEGTAVGNVSLELKTVQVSDEGIYKCIVKSSHWAAESQTVLHITALGNVSIELLGPEGEGIKLACKSTGWFPKPELQWLPQSNQNPQLELKQNHEQLFSVWSSITVFRDTREITCSVHERSHLQRKREATILLSEDSFPRTSPWLPAFCGLLILTLLLPVGFALYCRYKEQQRESKRKQDEEQGSFLENSRLKSENEELKRQLESLKKAQKSVNQNKPGSVNQDQNRKPDQQSKSKRPASQKSVRQHLSGLGQRTSNFFTRITS